MFGKHYVDRGRKELFETKTGGVNALGQYVPLTRPLHFPLGSSDSRFRLKSHRSKVS